jgi:hypothetical protein
MTLKEKQDKYNRMVQALVQKHGRMFSKADDEAKIKLQDELIQKIQGAGNILFRRVRIVDHKDGSFHLEF